MHVNSSLTMRGNLVHSKKFKLKTLLVTRSACSYSVFSKWIPRVYFQETDSLGQLSGYNIHHLPPSPPSFFPSPIFLGRPLQSTPPFPFHSSGQFIGPFAFRPRHSWTLAALQTNEPTESPPFRLQVCIGGGWRTTSITKDDVVGGGFRV